MAGAGVLPWDRALALKAMLKAAAVQGQSLPGTREGGVFIAIIEIQRGSPLPRARKLS